jgi:hypothetical protein
MQQDQHSYDSLRILGMAALGKAIEEIKNPFRESLDLEME